jgi:hypothetical protein
MSLKDKDLVSMKEEVGSLKLKMESIETNTEKIKKESMKQAENKFKSQIDMIHDELEKFRSAY